jgi:hypothetical protein
MNDGYYIVDGKKHIVVNNQNKLGYNYLLDTICRCMDSGIKFQPCAIRWVSAPHGKILHENLIDENSTSVQKA